MTQTILIIIGIAIIVILLTKKTREKVLRPAQDKIAGICSSALDQTVRKSANKEKILACGHDYKNAIKVGNIDYQCPLCGKLLDPNEWFFMNSFEFIDVAVKK